MPPSGRTIFEGSVGYLTFSFNFCFWSAFTIWLTERQSAGFQMKTCVKEEHLDTQLMRTNYFLKHLRDHADSEYVGRL